MGPVQVLGQGPHAVGAVEQLKRPSKVGELKQERLLLALARRAQGVDGDVPRKSLALRG